MKRLLALAACGALVMTLAPPVLFEPSDTVVKIQTKPKPDNNNGQGGGGGGGTGTASPTK